MDWYLWLSPLLLLPIVWLFYFVGCSLLLPPESELTPPPAVVVPVEAWRLDEDIPHFWFPDEVPVNVRVAFFPEHDTVYNVIFSFQVSDAWYEITAGPDFAEVYNRDPDPPRRRYRFRAAVQRGTLYTIECSIRRLDDGSVYQSDSHDCDGGSDLNRGDLWFGAWQDVAPELTRGEFHIDVVMRDGDPNGG